MNTIPEAYQSEINRLISIARGFLSAGEELQAFVFLGASDKPTLPCPMNVCNAKAKDKSAAIVRGIAEAGNAEFAIMISEAWALDAEKTTMEEFIRIAESRESIENHPNRIDVLMVTLETPMGFWVAQSPIKSSGGKARGFGEVNFEFLDRVEGRFTCFLPRRATH